MSFSFFFSEKGRRPRRNGKNFRHGAQTRLLICKVTMLGEINRKFPTQLDTLLRKKIICQYALCKQLSGGLWSFKLEVTKLARFHHKNEYAWSESMCFVNGSTIIGSNFTNEKSIFEFKISIKSYYWIRFQKKIVVSQKQGNFFYKDFWPNLYGSYQKINANYHVN